MVEVGRIEVAFQVATKEAEKGMKNMEDHFKTSERLVRKWIPGMDKIIGLGRDLKKRYDQAKPIVKGLFKSSQSGAKKSAAATNAATGNMRLFGMVSTAAMAPIMVGGMAAMGVMLAIIAVIVAIVASIVAFQQAAEGNFKNFIILMAVVAIAIGIIPAAIIAAVILIITQWDTIVAMFNSFIGFIGGVGKSITAAIQGAFLSAIVFVIGLIDGLNKAWQNFAGTFKLPSLGDIGAGIKGLLHLQDGGMITKSGLAMVHAGEAVIPSKAIASNQISNSITINMGNIAGVEDDFAMVLGASMQAEMGRF